MTQLDVFSLRDEAIEMAESGNSEWIENVALPAIQALSLSRRDITTDDVWEIVKEKPREFRAMGAAMREAGRRGWIRPTLVYRNSVRPDCHARPVRVWRSVRG